jgi:hypothetical protein
VLLSYGRDEVRHRVPLPRPVVRLKSFAANLHKPGRVKLTNTCPAASLAGTPAEQSPLPPGMSTARKLHYPDFETFKRLSADADLLPVYRRLVSDALTPVSAFHKIDAGRCACLFESVVGGEKVGRYSFLATEPFFEIEAYGNRVTTNAYSGVSAAGVPTLVTRQFESDSPLGEVRRRV